MKKSIILTVLSFCCFLAAQTLIASASRIFEGSYNDTNMKLEVRTRYSSWLRRDRNRRISGVSRYLYFKWLPKNKQVKNARLVFRNKTYIFKKTDKYTGKYSVSIRLKKEFENYFFKLRFYSGKKKLTYKLIAQQGYLDKARFGKLYIKKDRSTSFDKNGYRYVYNTHKGYLTYYNPKGKKTEAGGVTNIKFALSGIQFWQA